VALLFQSFALNSWPGDVYFGIPTSYKLTIHLGNSLMSTLTIELPEILAQQVEQVSTKATTTVCRMGAILSPKV